MTSAATLGIEGNSYIFDSFDDCSMILQVEKSGRTGYVFSESNSRGTDAVLLRDCEVSWGINAPFGLSSRDNVVSNASSAVIPVGPGRQRICMKCYSVTSSVKVRDDCPSLSFCSSECLSSSNAFLDECAPLITAVCSWGCDSLKTGARQYSDLAVLLILFLYNCEATRNASVSFQGIQNSFPSFICFTTWGQVLLLRIDELSYHRSC